MGMYDSISVFMECPNCKEFQTFDAQTKDLASMLHDYTPLDEDWETCEWGKAFRNGLNVFPKFPFDKSAGVWKDQGEMIEAAATLDEPFASKLKYVTVIAECEKCMSFFRGKIRVEKGKLVGIIYDKEEVK